MITRFKSRARDGVHKVASVFAEKIAASVSEAVSESVAEAVAAELAKTRVRLDGPDLIAQIASGKSRRHLNHLFTWNHRWIAMLVERNQRAARDTYDFIDEVMPDTLFTIDQFEVIGSKRDEIMALDGQILDLGVFTGGSTRALARLFPDRTIHGFDSFEGLPEDWTHMTKGGFGQVAGVLPNMPDNVILYKGWFDETLPVWFQEHHDRPISLLRVDCDLYSSTKTILTELRDLVVPGTWIVFDELIGYRGWREHEFKAFNEFIEETGYAFEYVAYGLTYTIVKLLDPSS